MPSKHHKSHKSAVDAQNDGTVTVSRVNSARASHSHAHASTSSASHNGAEGDMHSDFDDDAPPPAVLSRHQREEAQLAELFKRYAVRNWIFIYLLGVINNFHYNLVIAGASTLASSYGMKSLVALISFTNVFFGIIARIVNAFMANRVSYNIRMTLMSSGTLIGLFFVSLSGPFGRGSNVSSFVVLLVGVAFTGTSYCYGESVALTFVQRYPPKTVGAWGSGTGTSGVIASLLFLFLTNAGLSEQTIFLISMPLAVCYWLVFNFGIVAPHKVVMVTERNADGVMETERVVMHSGHEEKIARELHERLAISGGTVSDPEYKMIINFRGLSWKSMPEPPSEQVAAEEEAEAHHFNAHRQHSTLAGASVEDVEDGAELATGPLTSGNLAKTKAVGDGMVEPCQSPLTKGPRTADDADARAGAPQDASILAPITFSVADAIAAEAIAEEETTATGERTHGDDLHYACCRPLCGCYPRTCSLRRWWHMHGKVIGLMHNAMLWYMFNLCVVYITEYAAQFMAPFSFYCREDWEDNFWIKNSYTITQFCYQFGVFLSRSSLTFGLRIPFVGVLSIIQLCNAVVWFVQAKIMFIASHTSESKEVGLSFLLFVWMLFVGLVGGASYVNVFYLILCKGRAMQAIDENAKSQALIRLLRGDKMTSASRPSQGGDNRSHAEGPAVSVAVTTAPATTTTTPTTTTTATAVESHQREEQDGVFGTYSPAEGRDVDPAELSLSIACPEKKKKSGGKTVDGELLASSDSDSEGGNDVVALGDDATRDPHQASLLAHPQRVGATTHVHKTAHASKKTGADEHSSSDQPADSHSEGPQDLDVDVAPEEEAKTSCFARFWPFGKQASRRDANAVDAGTVADFKPFTPHEESELEELSIALAREWQSRRELAMAIGALYAMVGICIGTILDVIFTNTVLKHTVTC